jgi:hypothetical protein
MKDEQQMDAMIEKLDHLKLSALYVQDGLVGTDAEAVLAVQKQFEQLVDMFYDDFRDVVSPRQYQTARSDFEYFVVLLEKTRQHYLALKDGKGD